MDTSEIYYAYPDIEEIILNYKPADAVRLLTSLLNNNKTKIEKHFENAMIYYYIDSDLINTLKELDIILKINPVYIDALLLKGQILAGIHMFNKSINTLHNIPPKILPYGYKKLIEFIGEYNHRGTVYYSVFDFDSYMEYIFIESNSFKRFTSASLNYLQGDVLDNGFIWYYLDDSFYETINNSVPLVSGSRLSEEEPINESTVEKVKNCIVCGKKLKSNQKNLCKACFKKQYASRIIKKLVSVVPPEVQFKKSDLDSLNLDNIQLKDYIWTLQEFNLIDVDNNKFKLKDRDTINAFRIDSKMDPIDFDSLEKENQIEMTCNICGKTLSVSQFYKSSEGYEDICKICKKHMATAKYLEEVIKSIGFDVEFNETVLNEHISNKSQVMGIIWSLQENDLLIQNDNDNYELADESKCLEFLGKYDSDFDYGEVKSKSKVKPVSNVKVKSEKSKEMLEFDDDTSAENTDFKSSDDVKTQMDIVLKARSEGKTRKESAEIANIPLYKINHWYKEGKQGFGKDNVSFYRELKKIEDNIVDYSDADERKQMDFVLKLMRQGKSKHDAAKFTEMDEAIITNWYNQGENQYSENTVYFYNEVQKISIKSSDNKNSKSSLNKVESDRIRGKELRVKIKDFIPKFEKLDEKIVDGDVDNNKSTSLRKEIKSNIKLLKSAARLRRIDKLENCLSIAKNSYDKLTKEVKDLDNSPVKLLIKENSAEISRLRKKYSNDSKILDTLSKISFSNSKLNGDLNKGKNVRSEDALKIKNRLKYLDDSSNIKKKELLDFLYSITGNYGSSLKPSFISYLSTHNLYYQDGVHIRIAIKSEIDNGKLVTSYGVKLRIDELTKQKVSENNKKLIEYARSLARDIGKSSSSLSAENLISDDIKGIMEKIENEINDLELKSENYIYIRFKDLLEKTKKEKFENLLNDFYEIVGKDNLSDSFLKTLSENGLDENSGNYIKNIVEKNIKNNVIINKTDLNAQVNKLINDEASRQKRAISKLDELFINDNIYLEGLSSSERTEIKNIILKSIKDKRLNYLYVYSEFKKTIEEFKKNRTVVKEDDIKIEDVTEQENNEPSGGFLSKLKRFFSRK